MHINRLAEYAAQRSDSTDKKSITPAPSINHLPICKLRLAMIIAPKQVCLPLSLPSTVPLPFSHSNIHNLTRKNSRPKATRQHAVKINKANSLQALQNFLQVIFPTLLFAIVISIDRATLAGTTTSSVPPLLCSLGCLAQGRNEFVPKNNFRLADEASRGDFAALIVVINA